MKIPLAPSPHLFRFLALTTTLLYPLVHAGAQPAETTRTTSVDKEETVRMVPFEVTDRATKGPYTQEEVISVTKFAVALIDVPQNIFVFTRGFIEDLNVGALRDALVYNASMQGGVYSVGGSYRGFSNQEKLRDGFKMSAFFDYDPIHFERIELLKGPSAVMYGRTEPGGITNYVSKLPISGSNYARFSVGTGRSNKNTRQNVNWDINQSVGRPGRAPVVLRITGAMREYEDSKDSLTEYGRQRQASIRLAASYWLTDRTRVYASYQYYERDFDTQFGRYAAFAGAPVSQATPGHTIPFSIVYNRDPYEDYGFGRKFTWDFNDTQFIVDHKISEKLDFRFGFNLHKRTNEDYLLLIAATTLNGQGAIAQTAVNKNKNDAFFPDAQAHVIWKPAPDQNILVGISHNWAYEDVKQWFTQRNPDGTPFRRVYIPANGIPKSLPPDIIYVPTAHNSDPRKYGSINANYHGGFLENRLHLMAGIAYNKTSTSFKKTGLRPNPPREFKTDDTTPQLGAIYKITPEISAFVLGSKSTQFTLTRDSFNNYFGPVVGEGIEGGLKFAYQQGRFNGTLTYYSTEQKDNVVFDPLANSLAYQQSVAAGFPNPALRGDNAAAGVTASRGVEFELNGAITNNWNVQLSYAHSDQFFKRDTRPFFQGTKVPGLQPNTLAAFTRYNFSQGPADGLYVGGGVVWYDKSYGGFSPGSNNTKTYYQDGAIRLDFIAGYRFEAFGRENLIKFTALGWNQPKSFRAGFDPSRNDVYYLKAKPILQIDYAVTF